METSTAPRNREQQITEQGFVDAQEHLAAEAIVHQAATTSAAAASPKSGTADRG